MLLAENGSGSDLQHVGRLPVFHTNRLGIVVLIGESGLRMLTEKTNKTNDHKDQQCVFMRDYMMTCLLDDKT